MKIKYEKKKNIIYSMTFKSEISYLKSDLEYKSISMYLVKKILN